MSKFDFFFGKGGQKINKTNSKVQLKHIPTGIVVSSQFSRSREQNRKKAREILALKIEELSAPPGESRTAIIAEYKKNKARKKKSKSKKKYAAREAAMRESLLNGNSEDNINEEIEVEEAEEYEHEHEHENENENENNDLEGVEHKNLDGEQQDELKVVHTEIGTSSVQHTENQSKAENNKPLTLTKSNP
ncbi:uncharacterized protein SAPINGB_P002036 [Magnusiomyces paraingens]|uniref:Prokaryotic-type class I peptide chain release factors domain-containing protein n=1 Tax=Magnusiomyces paraingens TaxID=2606893 RepID=A0A5E8BHG7_9ASCO|nr:uncharacterized protein SAPINGB_P002036 [Saprochaete ingens]VVT48961.1 unnamed protein product [Saprochaete ingens]